MSTTPRTVLVVGRDAQPDGSGERLLVLLGWIGRNHPAVDLHVLLCHGGPLVHRIHDLAPTTVADHYDRRADHGRAALVLRSRWGRRWMARAIDRAVSAALPRRLPRVAADVVLLLDDEIAGSAAVNVDRRVPRVVAPPAAPGADIDHVGPQVWAALVRTVRR